jgi:hypothetical protein
MRRHAELLLILEEALALVTEDFDELRESSPDISTNTACNMMKDEEGRCQ